MLSVCVIATGRNCQAYVRRFIECLSYQTDKNFTAIIVDDASNDHTFEEIQDWVRWYSDLTIQAFQVNERLGAYACRNYAISLTLADIIIMADLDDNLLSMAVERIREQHQSGMLMSYGNYKDQDDYVFNHLEFPNHIHETRDYRKDKWRCTHLRSFRRELYMRIPKWELTQSEIDSYPDAEILFSMMEMCGKDRIGVITEPIYRFNNHNPNSTLRVYGKDQAGYDEICNRPKRELI